MLEMDKLSYISGGLLQDGVPVEFSQPNARSLTPARALKKARGSPTGFGMTDLSRG